MRQFLRPAREVDAASAQGSHNRRLIARKIVRGPTSRLSRLRDLQHCPVWATVTGSAGQVSAIKRVIAAGSS